MVCYLGHQSLAARLRVLGAWLAARPRAPGPRRDLLNQRPVYPLWLGGSASPTFRRAGERGVGWTISGYSPDEIREGRERLLAAWGDSDREGDPDVAANVDGYVTDDPVASDDPLVGSAEAVVEGAGAYRDAGATRLNLQLSSAPDGGTLTLDERIEQIERFGDEVLPAL